MMYHIEVKTACGWRLLDRAAYTGREAEREIARLNRAGVRARMRNVA